MNLVIETNLSMVNGQIHDFQSRVIEVSSWGDYQNEFIENKPVHRHASVGNMMYGPSIPHGAEIDNLTYDNHKLKCDIYSLFGLHSKKVSYLIE